MKRCINCGKEFTNEYQFCSDCGGKLAETGPTVSTGKESSLSNWAGAVVALLGLFVLWEVNWIYGLVIVGVGVFSGAASKNAANKAIAFICGAVAVWLVLIYIL